MVIHLNVTLLLLLYTVGCILCVSLIVMYFFYLQACLWDSSGQHGPFLLLQQVSGTQGCQCGCFFLRVLSMELNLISFRKHILTD